MFYLSIIGIKDRVNTVSASQSVSLYELRDKAKKFKKYHSTLKKGKAKVELYMIYTLLQICNDSLLGYDIKRAKMSRI